MPGIVGLITNKPREWAEPQLARMLQAVSHESFYVTGRLVDETMGVYFAWTALKGTLSDAMPHCNERGDVSLVFSGEEYSQQKKGPGDLVRRYEEDSNFPLSLNGMFHGLVIDRRQGTATVFNDRYGMHRLFYHEAKDAFYFGAEAKAILAVRPDLRTVDDKSIGEFVACSCVLEDRTIFAGIRGVPAGSAWTFRGASIERKNTYFLPSTWEQQDPIDPEAYFQELQNVLARNLPLYFAGRERVGLALTGGLDTRVIIAWHKPVAGMIPCFTFGGMFGDCQDVRLARRLARLWEQSHEVIRVGDEFLSRFPYYAERTVHLTEGGVDVNRASDLYLSERARHIAPVKVVGTYGSEIVRQAVMFKPMEPAPGLYTPEFLSHVHEARNTYTALRRQHPVTFAAFRQSPWYHHAVLALEQTQLTVRSPFLDNDFVRTVYRAPKDHGAGGDDIRLRLIRAGSPTLARLRSDRGVGGNSNGLASALLRRVINFTVRAEYAYDYGMPQWLARFDHRFSALHLERLFLGRHTLLHFRLWYRDALAEYVRQVLLDPRTLSRPYLERKCVEAMVQGHIKGDHNYTIEIHKLLTLELLHRSFVDPR